MKLIQVKDYDELSEKAAKIILDKIKTKHNAVLGLATGSTPIKMYDLIVEDHIKNGTSFKDIVTINLDEYVGLDENHPGSYRYYMKEHLFNRVDIDPMNAYVPNGTAPDLQAECRQYEALIDSFGGTDLQLLGIGENGHIGFNEPGTPFNSVTHVVELTPSTIKANSRFFNHESEVPTNAITMGIASILKSKEILLLISGKKKANAMHELLHGKISESFPASALKKHPRFTVICDEEALNAD